MGMVEAWDKRARAERMIGIIEARALGLALAASRTFVACDSASLAAAETDGLRSLSKGVFMP